MTEEEKLSIKSFEARIQQLIASYCALKKENEHLLSSIEQKDMEIRSLKAVNEQVKTDYDNLKIAKMISVSDSDLKEAKQKISNMVRNVNKCISILSAEEDAISEEEYASTEDIE